MNYTVKEYKRLMQEELKFYDFSFKARLMKHDMYTIGRYIQSVRKYYLHNMKGGFLNRLWGGIIV